MQLPAVTVNVQNEVQANIVANSGFRRSIDFSQFVTSERTPPSISVKTQDPHDQEEMDAHALDTYGAAYNPINHILSVEHWQQNVKLETEHFARKLGGLFRSAGIDTNQAITLGIDKHGQIYVQGKHYQKQAINSYLAANIDLSNEYHKVSRNNDIIALSRVNDEYNHYWKAATSEADRESVFNRFSRLAAETSRLKGKMLLARDSLFSASLYHVSEELKG